VITPKITSAQGSWLIEDALDDVGHEHRLGRVVLAHFRAVGARRVAAVDPRIDEIDGAAGVVDQIFSGGAAARSVLVPHAVGAAVLERLRPLQGGDLDERFGVGAQPGATCAIGTYTVAASFSLSRIGPSTTAEASAPARIAICCSRGVPRSGTRSSGPATWSGVARGDADDGADRERGHVVRTAGPATTRRSGR